MTDLERVREALPKDKPVACPNADGCLSDFDWAHSRCKDCPPHPSVVHPARQDLDAHLKEDAERFAEYHTNAYIAARDLEDTAAELAELRAENTRLNYELGAADYPGKKALVDRIQHLEAERDRLKQELDHIRQHHPVDDCPRENKGELFPSA